MSPQKSIIFGSLCGILLTLPVSAQILPDTTLGAENTVVTPIDATRDRIDGGAIRDINLFHSFLEFNIDTNRSVYFSNPVGVENILTRVTGNNLSNIDGRLGVLGEANLFLLNPNGIIFGENATLDIRGSFIASTSDSIQLGDNGFFSATDIDNSQLLSVQPGALFSNALSHHQARIENQGQLQVGGNLTLDSDILTLQGQLHAGGNLTLNARDTVTLRDSTTQEFIASAGGEMLIQGNESVDIFILNHPDSGLYAVGDMTLRSANPVIGDAHYETGGNFRIETLDGSLGNFYSPNDPIVLARGDFSIYSYRGASLHVLAGGSINIPGGITITGPDAFNRSINPDYTPGLATVTTSDGETVTINGAAEPTIDLRAGIAWPAGNFTIGTGSFDGFAQPPDWAYSPTATSADINVGRLFFFTEGRVLLTNQYRPNPALRGNITIAPTWGAIATDTRGTNGGFVTIDSKGDVNVQGRIVADAIAPWGNGGEVKLLAAGDINLSGAGSAITTSGVVGGEITLRSQGDINLYGSNIQSHTTSADPNRTGGNIQIEGNSLWALNGARINTRSNNNANAGDIAINLQNFGYLGGNSAVMSEAAPGSRGNSGNLSFSGNFLWMDNADFRSMTEGAGNAGNLDLNINGTAWVENNSQIGSTALPGSTGNGGRVNLSTGNLFLINGSNINAATSGAGNGGEINLNVRDRALISGLNTGIINSVAQTSTGEGNTINLTANQLEISNGAIVTSLTQGQGNAGNINIDVTGATVIDGQSRVAGISSSVGSSGIGNGGQINLNTGTLDMFNTAIIESDTHNIGDTGDINVNVRGLAIIEGQNTRIRTNINPGAVGNGGQLNFSSNQLYLGDGAQIQADTNGQGHAGNIRLAIADIAYLDGQNTSLSSQSTGIGNSGQIDLTSDWLSVRNGARITTSTFGQGHAGNINITAYDTAIFENNSGASSSVLGDAVGNGGQINLTTNWLELRNQSSLLSLTNSQGNAGNLNINARDRVIIDNRSAIGSTVFLNGEGNSGQINLTTNSLEVNNTAQISTATYGRGNAGNLHLAIGNTVTLDNSGIITSSVLSGAVGNGGNIDLTAAWLFMDGGSDLVAETAGQGNAGNIDINVTHLAQLSSSLNQDITGISSAVLAGAVGNGGQLNLNVGALEVVGEAAVSTGTKGQGNAGTLNITARDRVLIDSNGRISSQVSEGGVGQGGDLNITTDVLNVSFGGRILNGTNGKGDAGNLNIIARDAAIFEGGSVVLSAVSPNGIGNGGDINIETQTLEVKNASLFLANTFNQGNAGNINFNVRDVARFDNSFISSSVFATGVGNGGNINLNANTLEMTNDANFITGTQGQGHAGNVNLRINDAARLDNESTIRSDVLGGVGNGGQIGVTARSLSVTNGSQLSTNTDGQGNAGNVSLAIQEATILDGVQNGQASNISSQVGKEGVGNGGQVSLATNTLTVTNGGQFNTSTYGRGNAGNVDLQVNRNTIFDGGSQGQFSGVSSDVGLGAIGEGGAINLTADSLQVSNRAILSSSTFGRGNAGSLNLQVRDGAVFDGNSLVSTAVSAGAVGNGGQLNVAANSLQVANGAQLSTRTFGQGNAGNLNLNIRNQTAFDNNSLASSEVGAGAVGNGGQVNLATETLNLTRGSSFSASTSGQGNAGNVEINVRGDAVFDGAGSGAFSLASADSVGNGGEITVNSRNLQLSNNAALNSSAEGVGVAGNIAVNTGALNLDRASILTETRSGDGGNISLDVNGILLMRHESLISTTAGTAGLGGNGGNIDINAEFVIGVAGENSDITANAFEGQGGNITITTNGIYGLRFRPKLTPLSDITASSTLGINGTYTLNLLSFPAEQGMNELPGALVDAEGLVGRDVCAVQNNQIAGGSSFVVTGKGGLPPNPVDLMTPNTGMVDWATRSPDAVAIRQRSEPLSAAQIQQTQGWVVAPDGTVELTATAPTAAMGAQGYGYPTCENWRN